MNGQDDRGYGDRVPLGLLEIDWRHALKRAFCKLYELIDGGWQALLHLPGSPFAAVVNWIASSCKYCLAWRALFVGAGATSLAYGHPWTALIFFALVGLAVGAERAHQSCAAPPPE